MPLLLVTTAALAASMAAASPALAAWIEDGVPACTAPDNQLNPVIVSDRTGGAIIVWRDFRNDAIGVYAQHLDAAGNPLWTADGLLDRRSGGVVDSSPCGLRPRGRRLRHLE